MRLPTVRQNKRALKNAARGRATRRRREKELGRSLKLVRETRAHPLYKDKKFLDWLDESNDELRTLLTPRFRGF
ncbi:MAG TPA: hypothetical protein VN345_11225 [Blastocatellia bacterium]|jgi:hypothetical protein|nr:hypothetical protein [Blastocatellia bacterium]